VAVKTPLPPTYLFTAIVVMVLLHMLFANLEVVPYPWRLFGCAPLLFGIILNLLADKAFKHNHTTVKPFEESASLITSGVFRFSRHPMYLGMVMILVGIALLLGSLLPFLVIPAFVVLMDVLFISTEERMLADKFGDTWKNYQENVRRWI
jgi:protein-S-isoprenylcysteine O-methyltransferase Ste14